MKLQGFERSDLLERPLLQRESMRSLLLATIALALASACAAPPAGGSGYDDHDEPSDLVPEEGGKLDGLASTFDRHDVLSDELFGDVTSLDAAAVQAFLEATPYDRRSWLADELVDGRPASEVIVEVAVGFELSPLMLLARLQVERSLIGKEARPSDHAVNYAMGCGCFDGAACDPDYKGFDTQLTCAAHTLRRWYDESAAGTGHWRKDKTRRSEDDYAVTPVNHATASLYAYTPWVLPGRGGNWLVWNVTRKFHRALFPPAE